MNVYKTKLQLLFFAFGIISCSTSQQNTTFELKTGDILFQDLDCGAYCESIESVTTGVGGAHLSHCGIVSVDQEGNIAVIEAISSGVSSTPLDSFLVRSFDDKKQPKVLVGRMKNWTNDDLDKVVNNAQSLIGRAYDKMYLAHDETYYCSELVYMAFRKQGETVFQLEPMTFIDPKTGQTFPEWQRYFDTLRVVVPEGKLGINPGGISQSDLLEIVHAYGKPEGYKD